MSVLDVLCAGQATFDIVFTVDHHPAEDEKTVAQERLLSGGGPAANAAVTVSRLGGRSGFIGVLTTDLFGEWHYRELEKEKVNVEGVWRCDGESGISVIIVKPNGNRSVIHHREPSLLLPPEKIHLEKFSPTVLLTDGHEPLIIEKLLHFSRDRNIPVVVDAGSYHRGTAALLGKVAFFIASGKFSREFTREEDPWKALEEMKHAAETVIITLGAEGCIWKSGKESGHIPAEPVEVVDTTGAGDAFHGAFAYGLSLGYSLEENLRFATRVAARCCQRLGARPGIPTRDDL
ncbi:MAG: carbohydrate kinase family protein [Calditrichaeota bacterium]|nr:MAG: carbohydrate kinase family protein [Calditrichota bacterium]